ncbi:MAG: DUF1080 domain-containing protein [Candidatus Hydrogenedentes bacterium]|nr:DUF1080 domain-containing protein [Candidatus Hydrogenedentota bacterium]
MNRRLQRWALTAALALLPAIAGAQAVESGNWINLFDGETLFGWTQFGDIQWQAKDSTLLAEKGTGGWLATTSRFANFELSLQIKQTGPGTAGVVFRGALEGHPSANGSGVILLGGKENDGAWHTLSLTAVGNAFTATLDGKAIDGVTASNSIGHIGIQYHRYHGNGSKAYAVEVKDVKLRPLGLEPLFNGTDLTGWNILPDKKSKFNVVEGAINITDGNGQIETAGTYKDFVLQLDIISNGEKLNSGVFYRGPVGVFWKGYESQVRNDWQKDDRTKPNDFGTGGNYGNQPTRKVVSTDHEWFQKTIVVDGNHASVWINGYLTSDFFDTRPVSPESDGKNGFVDQAGTIHLQGHDPTTNLSFKNINIQVYPEN